MIEVKNLGQWVEVKPGEGWEMDGDGERSVTITVRAEAPTCVGIATKEGEYHFLARVESYERIRFRKPKGGWAVVADDTVHIDGIEKRKAATVIEDARIFTKIWERKPRNPLIEEMAGVMQQNMLAMQAQLQREADARESRWAAENKALRAKVQKTEKEGEADDDSEVDRGEGVEKSASEPGKGKPSTGGSGGAGGEEKPAKPAERPEG